MKKIISILKCVFLTNFGSRDGAVVKAFASHQCGLGSNLGRPGVKCGLSLLLVFILALRVFLFSQKTTFLNSNSDWKQWKRRATLWISTEIPIYLFIFIYLNADAKKSKNILAHDLFFQKTPDIVHDFVIKSSCAHSSKYPNISNSWTQFGCLWLDSSEM